MYSTINERPLCIYFIVNIIEGYAFRVTKFRITLHVLEIGALSVQQSNIKLEKLTFGYKRASFQIAARARDGRKEDNPEWDGRRRVA